MKKEERCSEVTSSRNGAHDAEWDIEEAQKVAGRSVSGGRRAFGRDSEGQGVWLEAAVSA